MFWRVIEPMVELLCFVLPLLFLLFYVILMFPKNTGKSNRRSNVNGRLLSIVMLTAAFDLLLMGTYAYLIEPNWLEVTQTDITTSKWRQDTKPLKIVQLSDLHIEKFGYREKRTISMVNNLKPDIIVLTGDYKNFDKGVSAVRLFFQSLNAKFGVYAVDGNWTPMPSVEKLTSGTGVSLLNYDNIDVDTDSGRLRLIGIPWHEARWHKPHIPLKRVRQDEYVILLCHMPNIARNTPDAIDLVLSGHTHGGQVRIPFVESIIDMPNIHKNRLAGLIKLDNGKLMYVTRGIGMEGGWAPRIRFRCRPEISVITISPSGK
ncbi:MAG: metallophosphoesterase [Armatimonadota bacterium]